MRRLLYSAYQRTFRRTSECSIKAKTFLQNGRTFDCVPQFCIQELRTGKRRVKKLPTIFTIILGNDSRDAEEKLTAHRIKNDEHCRAFYSGARLKMRLKSVRTVVLLREAGSGARFKNALHIDKIIYNHVGIVNFNFPPLDKAI